MSASNKGPNVDYRLQNLTNALYLDGNDDVVVRTGFVGNIVISGNVNVPGTITVDSTPENPVHNHITEVGTSGILDVPYLPIGGNVIVNSGNVNANVHGNVGIVGNIAGITSFPAITGNVIVSSGNVNANVSGNVGIIGNVNVTQGTDPWRITGNANIINTPNVWVTNTPDVTGNIKVTSGSINANVSGNVIVSSGNIIANVTGSNVGITGNVNIGTMPEVEIKNDTGNAIPISIIKNGIAISDTVALPTRVFNDEGLIAISRGSPITESDIVASYLIDKSGATASLGTDATTMVTIWDGSGLYPWNTFTGSGDKLYVKTSTDDPKVRGKTVILEGLDSGYNLISETITLNNSNSTTAVSTTLNFYRVVRATLSGTNTNYLPHDYNVEIRYGSSSGTLVEQITAPYGRTQSCLYSVPAGHEAYILNVNGSSGYNDEITSMIWTRPYNDTWRQIKTFKFISGTYEHNFRTPIRIPEKSDLEMRAYALVESSRIGVEFQLLIVPKP